MSQMPGPYPVFPQQQQNIPGAPKPPAPQTVMYAFYCMLGGAVLAAVNILVALTERDTIRNAFEANEAANPALSGQDVDTLVSAVMVFVVIGGLIGVGLWLWMAFKNRAGRNWARITGTVFFGIEALSTLGSLAVSSGSNTTFAANTTAGGKIVGVLGFLVGLAAVILLWHKQSGPYFKAPEYPYGYPQMPGYFAPGYPAQGQPYPYGQQPPTDQAPDPAAFQAGPGLQEQAGGVVGEQQQQPENPWGTPPQ